MQNAHRRCRIIYFDHIGLLGGGEVALCELVSAMDRTRFEPIVVLFSEGKLTEKLAAAGIQTVLIPLAPAILNTKKDQLHGYSLFGLGRICLAALFVLKLRRLLKKLKPDLVHTNSLKADLLGGAAAKLLGLPLIWHVRDRISPDYLPEKVAKTFRFLARHIPDFIIANSAATLATLQLPAGCRTQVIYSGKKTYRQLEGKRVSDHCTVGLVGRLAPWKGQHVFIEAAARVLQKHPDARFLIVGGPVFGEKEYEARCIDLVRDRNLSSQVTFLGHRDDVDDLIRTMDIVVHASTTGEPFGQVIVEGMAAGKPIVATRGGGVPEIVVDGETGLLVPMDDATAMAEAIMELINNPTRRAEMGGAGHKRFEDRFTLEETVRAVQAIYIDLLSQSTSIVSALFILLASTSMM